MTAAAIWAGAVLWLSAIGLVVFGPALESEFLPVVTDAAFVVVAHDQDRMTVDWTARRHRGHCEFKGVSANVWRKNEWHPAILSRAGDGTDAPLPGRTVPEGWQRFSRMDVIPDGSALRVTLRQRCHPLWMTVTQLPAVVP